MIRHAPASALALASLLAVAACGDPKPASDTTSAMTATASAVPGPTAAAAPSADAMDDRVERALATDSVVRRYGLDADDDDNRLILKGVVRSESERAHAAMVASGLAAGVTVDNRIRIDANAKGSDNLVDVDDLEDQIEDALEADSTFRGHDVDIDEDNGRLVLEGKAPAAVKSAAEALAKRMAGTVQVVNRITTP